MSSAHGSAFRPPEEKRKALKRADRLSWISIALMASIIVVIGSTMGGSEAMKAVWIEDLLSLVPPVAYLIGAHWRDKDPTDEFPYGYRRAGLIGYLVAAVALLALGVYILGEAATTLFSAEHPTIGTIGFHGHRIWLGWLMIAALIYSVIPPLILARYKLPLARELHQKTLQTDAELNKGDWLTGIAGVFGILGIGLGYWWADAAAAAVIAFEVVNDGLKDLKNSTAQLMNRRPSDVATNAKDPALARVEAGLKKLPWVKDLRVRLREDGDVLSGEVFVVPRDEERLMERVEEATKVSHAVDWRLHDINIVLVRSTD